MSTLPLPQKSAPRLLRPKYLVFAFVGLMIAYVVQHNESFLIDAADPEWEHIQPIKWWLLPHGIAGALAIMAFAYPLADLVLLIEDRLRTRSAPRERDSAAARPAPSPIP